MTGSEWCRRRAIALRLAKKVQMLGADSLPRQARGLSFPKYVHHASSRKGVGLFRRHPTLSFSTQFNLDSLH